MLYLTCDNFIKARDYIFANAEDVDRAWFRYIFEDKDEDAFLDVLAKYQYDNGGFGGMYYEFDYQGPCLKSTEIAVKYNIESGEKAICRTFYNPKSNGISIGQLFTRNRQLG